MKYLKLIGVALREGLAMTIVFAVLFCAQLALIRWLGKTTLMEFGVFLLIPWLGIAISSSIRDACLGGSGKLAFIRTAAHANLYRTAALSVGMAGIFLAIMFFEKFLRNPDGVGQLLPFAIALFCGLNEIRYDLAARSTDTPRKH